MFFRKKKKRTENSHISELQRLLGIVEKGFFCNSKLLDRVAAASALGSMKTILRIMNEPLIFKGTQAENLEIMLKERQ